MWPFDWFQAGSDTTNSIIDKAASGLDAIVYTDQEKSEMRLKLAEWHLEMQKTLGQESSIRSVTRRLIAFMILVPYVGLIISAAILHLWFPEYSQFLLNLVDSRFGVLAWAVGGFYFGPHMIGRAFNKK
ncbi:MAG: hypothetical protein OQK82_00685 [Candidatus Pacearchaeota archaeon]|nr:hypothetical protein [Candidatus Pacearchaeota archaeon]